MRFFTGCLCISLFLFLNTISSLSAQGWEKHYTYEFPLKSLDHTAAIDATADGGAILGINEFTSPDTFNVDKTIKLIKIDQDGVIQWQQKFSKSTTDQPSIEGIKLTPDGGYIVSGNDEGSTPTSDFYLKKFNNFGQLEWKETYSKYNSISAHNDVAVTLDGGYLATSSFENTQTQRREEYVIKTDSLGQFEWDVLFGLTFYSRKGNIIVHSDNTYSIVSRVQDSNNNMRPLVTNISSSGVINYSKQLNGTLATNWHTIDAVETDNGGVMTVAEEGDGSFPFLELVESDTSGNLVQNISTGIYAWAFVLYENTKILNASDDGYIICLGYSNFGDNTTIYKLDSFGNIEWTRDYPGAFTDATNLTDGSYLFSGHHNKTLRTVKLDNDGNTFTSFLEGYVQSDTNFNCTGDATETGLKNLLVEAKDGSKTFYDYTDATGFYSINLDSGTYNLDIVNPSLYWFSCNGPQTINISNKDTITTDLPNQPLVSCWDLRVDISTPRLRRCTDNNYFIDYCNLGTIPSPNSTINITFHPDMAVQSSSIPWSNQSGNVYSFPVSGLNVNECGQFMVTVMPICDSTVLGQTLCVQANILPDTICTNPLPIWDGSITTLDVSCGTDSLTFTIENTGLGNMANPIKYLVIEDNLILKTGQTTLLSMEVMSLKFPSNGKTYRLYADQSPGYFSPSYHPTIAYEGCGVNANGTFSTGFITMFPESDVLNNEVVNCQEIIGSYDPNDKKAAPKGYGPNHYIEAGDDLEYHIRFQNTGTDTAFLVVLRDTISEHLNIASLQPGASSHPYTLDIINGKALKFTFNDILLVDSTTNEPGSHGFVKFKISQDTSLPLGTLIHNSAAIYFDFNAPIITNQTYHEIGQDFIPIVAVSNVTALEYPALEIKVQPNPFVEYAEFLLENAPSGEKVFELYDAMGRRVAKESFSTDFSHKFYNEQLTSGFYFYKIIYQNKILVSGKLIAGN